MSRAIKKGRVKGPETVLKALTIIMQFPVEVHGWKRVSQICGSHGEFCA